FWTAGGFARATGGRLRDVAPDAPLCGLSIDTRALNAGQAYLALRGERFDGHDFLAQARDAGAALLIADRADAAPADAPVLLVDDALEALQQLAARWRDRLAQAGVRVIAITGSS